MAYTYDLTTSIGKLRLACGDTISTEVLLADAEYQALIDEYGANADGKLQCLYAIRAKWSRDFDRSSIGLSSSRSQRITAINDMIRSMEELRDRGNRLAARSYLYGSTYTEKATERSDADRVQPTFTRGQFDNRNGGSSSDEDGA